MRGDLPVRLISRKLAQLLRRMLVNEFLQFLASLEIGNAFGRNANRVACLRVTASAGATLTHAKAAKTPQLDLLALVQTLNYAFENYFDQSLSIFLGQLSGVGHVIDKIGFSHAVTSLTKRPLVPKPGELILQEHSKQDKGRVGARLAERAFYGKTKKAVPPTSYGW
jgi:hypothetical protein